MIYEKSDTLVGNAIYFKLIDSSNFSLTINKSGILLSDGQSEINIEIGENGIDGNSFIVDDIDNLTEREVRLIYEIGLYQYKQFQLEKNNC
jgi:hypothetical protein